MKLAAPMFVLALVLLPCLSCGGGSAITPDPDPDPDPGPGPGPGPAGPVITAPEVEPNDGTPTATPLAIGGGGSGALLAADAEDFWRFDAPTDDFGLRVELHGARLDQAGWDAQPNLPVLTLIDSDGTTPLLQHGLPGGGDGISGYREGTYGRRDMGFFAYRIPTAGTYFLRVARDTAGSPGGSYVIVLRALDLGSMQSEVEPNAGFMTATPITPGYVEGVHAPNEADYYQFDIVAPAIASFEIIAARNGAPDGTTQYPEPVLNLRDTDGMGLLGFLDGTTGSPIGAMRDGRIRYLFTTTGTYYLEVTGGAAGGTYLLEYQVEPLSGNTEAEPNNLAPQSNDLGYGQDVQASTGGADPDFWDFVASAGDMVRVEIYCGGNFINHQAGVNDILVTFLDSNENPVPMVQGPRTDPSHYTARTIIRQSGTYYIRVLETNVPAPTMNQYPYALRLSRVRDASFESEANNDTASANDLNAGGRGAGIVAPAGDVDVFRFEAEENELVSIACYAGPTGGPTTSGDELIAGHGSTLMARLRVLDAGGNPVASSSDTPPSSNGTRPESVTDALASVSVSFVAPTAGMYFIEVGAADGTGSTSHTYVIERQ